MHFSSTFTTALVVSGSSAPDRAPGPRQGHQKSVADAPRPSHDPVGGQKGGGTGARTRISGGFARPRRRRAASRGLAVSRGEGGGEGKLSESPAGVSQIRRRDWPCGPWEKHGGGGGVTAGRLGRLAGRPGCLGLDRRAGTAIRPVLYATLVNLFPSSPIGAASAGGCCLGCCRHPASAAEVTLPATPQGNLQQEPGSPHSPHSAHPDLRSRAGEALVRLAWPWPGRGAVFLGECEPCLVPAAPALPGFSRGRGGRPATCQCQL